MITNVANWAKRRNVCFDSQSACIYKAVTETGEARRGDSAVLD